jgi:hypothetical protein
LNYDGLEMSKIKPILFFIIASITLHGWILSLPMFTRIQTLEGIKNRASPPTLVAYLDQTQPSIKPPEKTQFQTQATEGSITEDSSKPLQPTPLPPSFLRGSPWSRRPAESMSGNPAGSGSIPILTQLELRLQNEFPLDQPINLECRRSGIERLFVCQSENNEAPAEKVAKALNQLTTLVTQLPGCLVLESQEKKWHAKACHS